MICTQKVLGFDYPLFMHQLQLFVNTFQEKSIPNSIAIHLWQQIVQGIVHGIVEKIVHVDGPNFKLKSIS
jgi:hypothetical protein